MANESNHIDLSNGGSVDYTTREDGKGTNWTVSDSDGNVLEYGRDKTEPAGDGAKHHRVNEFGYGGGNDASQGWNTDSNASEKKWDNWGNY